MKIWPGSATGLFSYVILAFILPICSHAAANVPLLFIFVQNCPHLFCKHRIELPQARLHVLMYCGFADAEFPRAALGFHLFGDAPDALDRPGPMRAFAAQDALIMVVDRDGQHTLGLVLTDDILIQTFLDLGRGHDVDIQICGSGLDMGADDYITKPFAIEELLARIRVILRKGSGKREEEGNVLSACGVLMNVASHTVTCEGKEIALTNKEFSLLQTLLENKNIVL